MVVSPNKLWESYNRTLLPLDVSEIGSVKTDFGTEKGVYYNGEASANGCTRIYTRYLRPDSATDKAVVVMLSPESDVNTADFSSLLQKGWAVLAVDYAGNIADRSRFTIYPAALSFANYKQSDLYLSAQTPQKTCWYIWTAVCLRALTFAESEGFTRVAMVGVGIGGANVFKTAALSDFPVCGLSVFSPGFFPPPEEGELLSENACVDVTGYAPMLKVPFLHLCCSNDSDASLDEISELSTQSEERAILSLKQSGDKSMEKDLLYIAPRVNHSFTKEMHNDCLLFLDTYLSKTTSAKEATDGLAPEVKFSVSGAEDKMYFSLSCGARLKEVKVYVSHGMNNCAYRNWRTVPVEKVGENEYIGYTTVYSADNPVYSFASVTTETGFVFSTQVQKKIPAALNIRPTSIAKKRLIYDSDMGIDDFFTADPHETLTIEKGPFGIDGICAGKGVCTYKLGDVMYSGTPDAVLQLMLFSPIEQEITFSVTEDELFTSYSCTKTVSPETDWTKIMLSLSDFKSAEGTLPGWHKAILLRIDAKEKIIISSILWV